jgi:uncharacterized protein with NAD-binding domain and iron-sulfur cluster
MTPPITRRRLLRDAGVATVAAAELLAAPPAAGRRRGRRRPTVAVFGGGIAGMTAAHELIERGFEVTVYERRAWGGKARSTEVPLSGTGGRRNLPGEHAYRVPFGCYQNVPAIMRRIPFGTNANGVFDNLVPAPQVMIASEKARDLVLPIGALDPRPYTPQQILDLIIGLLIEMQLTPDAAAFLASRMAVFFSSCDARRLGQWERTTWSKFVGADRYGGAYRLISDFPRFAQASKAGETSTKYLGWVLEVWIIYSLLGFGSNGPPFRVLNAPTNEAWINPWTAELRRLGTRLRLNHTLAGLKLEHGRIVEARVHTPHGRRSISADWYVCALPVERARRFWTPAILDAAPALGRMANLRTDWMNGMSFYLRQRPDIVDGHFGCVDTPWAITGLPQTQFWASDFARTYGDGTVHEKVSVAVADFHTPGVLYDKPARDCTPREFAAEVWEQLKRSINNEGGAQLLTDAMLHSWQIDPGLTTPDGGLDSEDPLILPTVATEQYRPSPATAIHNLFLAGDYLNGAWEVANMEAACYEGRRAADAILGRAGSHESGVNPIGPYRPPEWEPLKLVDEDRWKRGQPNLFDVADLTSDRLRSLLSVA